MRLNNIMSNNFHSITIRGVTLYFSYETLIGVNKENTTLVAKNEWSRTTGKHLNFIKDLYEGVLEVDQEEVEEFAYKLL